MNISTPNEKSFAIVVNCWDDSNKGDAAITMGVLKILQSNGVATHFGVSSYKFHSDAGSLSAAFRHVRAEHPVELIPACFPHVARSAGLARGTWLLWRAILKLLLPNVVPDSDLEAAIRRSQVVVSNGGFYFGFVPSGLLTRAMTGRGIWIWYHLFALSYPMLFARRTGIPYVLYAQSFGPFPGRLSRWWMKKLVGGSLATWTRESYSRRLLESLGAPGGKIDVMPDAAFANVGVLDSKKRLDIESLGLEKGNYVVISVRSLDGWGHSQNVKERYQSSFVQLITWLATNTELTIALVAHGQTLWPGDDDRVLSGQLYEKLPGPVRARVRRVEEDLSPLALAQLYGHARLVIGTRFHAVVLAICGGAPVVTIPIFGLKTQGTLNDLGLSEYVITLDNLTPEILISRVSESLKNHLEIRPQIQARAMACYEGAMESGKRLRLLLLEHARLKLLKGKAN